MHLNIFAALLFMAPAAFATPVDLKTKLLSCQQVSEEEQRLSCFDQIVSSLDSVPAEVSEFVPAVAPEATMPASQQAVTPAGQDVTAKFGLKNTDLDTEISSVVKEATYNLRKKALITLENGQQWQQTDQDYLKINVGDRCVVERAAFGSFLFGVEGLNKKIRVRRVQ